jgi:hypothetical protein
MSHRNLDEFLANYNTAAAFGERRTGWEEEYPISNPPSANDRENVEWKKRFPQDWHEVEVVNDYGETVKEWQLKDPVEWWYHKPRLDRVTKYDTNLHWHASRLSKPQYEARKEEIYQNGIGQVVMRPQLTGNLYSLRVMFPPGFRHLTNQYGQMKKLQDNAAGYHISLGYWRDVQKNPELRNAMNAFLMKYYDTTLENIDIPSDVAEEFNWVKVGGGSTYEINDDTEFANDLRDLVKLGTGKTPHISLD